MCRATRDARRAGWARWGGGGGASASRWHHYPMTPWGCLVGVIGCHIGWMGDGRMGRARAGGVARQLVLSRPNSLCDTLWHHMTSYDIIWHPMSCRGQTSSVRRVCGMWCVCACACVWCVCVLLCAPRAVPPLRCCSPPLARPSFPFSLSLPSLSLSLFLPVLSLFLPVLSLSSFPFSRLSRATTTDDQLAARRSRDR